MNVNTSKTIYQTFSLCHRPLQLELYFNNVPIEYSENTKYLGVIFDHRLSWKLQLENLEEKSRRRLAIIKRLTGFRWGCDRSTLLTTYRTYVKPVLKYCCAPLITASKGIIEKIDRIQNQALRLITGGVKSSPISAMLLCTDELSMEKEIVSAALKLYEKQIRLPHGEKWASPTLTPRRLKTQDGFLQCVVREKISLDLDSIPEALLPPDNPLEFQDFSYCLDLTQPVLKSESCPEVLFSVAMETIHSRYPSETWLRIYTDGSKNEANHRAGSGIFCELFSHFIPLGIYDSAFNGEIAAIKNSLQLLTSRLSEFSQAVILSDSQAAILAIVNFDHTPILDDVRECRKTLRELLSSRKIVLQWIPSHCGIFGNEMADDLAKKATNVIQAIRNPVAYKTVSHLIKLKIKHRQRIELTELAGEKTWFPSILNVPDRPRDWAVAAFRLTTGHDCLAAHLYKIKILSSPLCPLCNDAKVMDNNHLLECPALHGSSIAARYWEARDLLSTCI